VGRVPEQDWFAVAFTDAARWLYLNNYITPKGLSHTTVADKVIPLLGDGTCPPGTGTNVQWNAQAGDSLPISCTVIGKCPAGAAVSQSGFTGEETYDCDCPKGTSMNHDMSACVPPFFPWEVPYAALQFWRNNNMNAPSKDPFPQNQATPYVKSADELYRSMAPTDLGQANLQSLLPGIDLTVPFTAIPWDWLKLYADGIQWETVESAINDVQNMATQQKGTTDFSPVAMGADTAPPLATQTDWASVNWGGAVPGSTITWYNIWPLLDPNSDSNITHLPWFRMPWTVPGFRAELLGATTTPQVVAVVTKYLAQQLGVNMEPPPPPPPKAKAGDPCILNGANGKYAINSARGSKLAPQLVCVVEKAKPKAGDPCILNGANGKYVLKNVKGTQLQQLVCVVDGGTPVKPKRVGPCPGVVIAGVCHPTIKQPVITNFLTCPPGQAFRPGTQICVCPSGKRPFTTKDGHEMPCGYDGSGDGSGHDQTGAGDAKKDGMSTTARVAIGAGVAGTALAAWWFFGKKKKKR
jgi:hypothetical protein